MDTVTMDTIIKREIWFFNLQVHFILNELVMGGMVLETNMTEIMLRIEEQNKIEKEEVRIMFRFWKHILAQTEAIIV